MRGVVVECLESTSSCSPLSSTSPFASVVVTRTAAPWPLILYLYLLTLSYESKKGEEFWDNARGILPGSPKFGKGQFEKFLWVLKLGIAFQISHLYCKFESKDSSHIIYYNIITVVVIFDLIVFITVSSQARGIRYPGTRLQA